VTSDAITALAPRIGTRAACAATGVPRASWYRRHRASPPPERRPPVPHRDRAQPRALAPAERQAILDALHSPRFADLAPAEIWAVLLDEGTYLGPESTFCRLLRAAGETRERRRQAVHPAAVKPELLAAGPDQVWSWDITKLHGPAKWAYYYLYVIIDIHSRYVTGWMLAPRESAALAEKLIAATCAKQGISRGQLAIHADRGSSMISKPVAFLLAGPGVTQSHSRPHVSNDNPYSEAQLPGSGQESHLPAPTDPDVSLSAHPARAVQSFGQYRSAQCANSRGASSLTPFSHSRALLSLRSSRLYFLCAQRIRWRSMRWQSGITLLG
jgi:putative transposase